MLDNSIYRFVGDLVMLSMAEPNQHISLGKRRFADTRVGIIELRRLCLKLREGSEIVSQSAADAVGIDISRFCLLRPEQNPDAPRGPEGCGQRDEEQQTT